MVQCLVLDWHEEKLLETKRQSHPVFFTELDAEIVQQYSFGQQGIPSRLGEPTDSSPWLSRPFQP
jgi:hypothetical protein